MVYHPFRHPGLKVLAVALATLLWLTVAGEHIVERSLRVPLEFRNIPQELEISGEPPATVAVRLRGSSALLSRIDPGEIVAVLDLSNARAGSRLLNIRNDEVRVPYGVEVAQVMPGTLSVELEKSARRVVRVLPAVEGDPAPGYVVGRTHTDPGTVEVVGPESRLKQLSNATTEPVSRPIGIISRFRKRSTSWPPSRSTASPLPTRSARSKPRPARYVHRASR